MSAADSAVASPAVSPAAVSPGAKTTKRGEGSISYEDETGFHDSKGRRAGSHLTLLAAARHPAFMGLRGHTVPDVTARLAECSTDNQRRRLIEEYKGAKGSQVRSNPSVRCLPLPDARCFVIT